jgi:hypothetical protein
MDHEKDDVVIYWRPDCMFCLNLLLRLTFTRPRYRKVNITKDPRARVGARRGGVRGAEGRGAAEATAARHNGRVTRRRYLPDGRRLLGGPRFGVSRAALVAIPPQSETATG